MFAAAAKALAETCLLGTAARCAAVRLPAAEAAAVASTSSRSHTAATFSSLPSLPSGLQHVGASISGQGSTATVPLLRHLSSAAAAGQPASLLARLGGSSLPATSAVAGLPAQAQLGSVRHASHKPKYANLFKKKKIEFEYRWVITATGGRLLARRRLNGRKYNQWTVAK